MTEAKLKNVVAGQIEIDGGTQARVKIDEATVAEYVEAIEAGAEFPPLEVWFDGTTYWLSDGFHRFHSYQRLGIGLIPCLVRRGTKSDAQWASTGANKSHGLRRSNADKRKAVELALSHPKAAKLSDRAIAEHVGVNDKTVASVRKERGAEIPHLNGTRTGRDGKQYPARPKSEKPYTAHGLPPSKQRRPNPGGLEPNPGGLAGNPGGMPAGQASPADAPDDDVPDEAPRPSPVVSSSSSPADAPTAPSDHHDGPVDRVELPSIADVLDRINAAGDAIEGYATSDDGRTVDVPKALGHLKHVKSIVAGGARPHVIAGDVAMPPAIDTPDGRAALGDWLLHKRKRGESYKDAGQVAKQLKRFAEFTSVEFRHAVDFSIGQNYAGLFAEKTNGGRVSGQRSAPGSEYRPGVDEDRSF